MPYISSRDRYKFSEVTEAILDSNIDNGGELQYLISELIAQFMADKPHRYKTMNEVMGALNGANLEYYRVVVAPYEDKAIAKNGTVKGYNQPRGE